MKVYELMNILNNLPSEATVGVMHDQDNPMNDAWGVSNNVIYLKETSNGKEQVIIVME